VAGTGRHGRLSDMEPHRNLLDATIVATAARFMELIDDPALKSTAFRDSKAVINAIRTSGEARDLRAALKDRFGDVAGWRDGAAARDLRALLERWGAS
jgi:hypothetical protein